MLEEFRAQVCEANRRMAREGLATLTWGNVSGYDRTTDTVAIKPSGVPFDQLAPQHIVLVDLDGNVVEGRLRPSSDTPTHCLLYRAFKMINGICHTPSLHATMFAQAGTSIPCMGAIHAAHFYGSIPVTRQLTESQVLQSYEANTGRVIVETFRNREIDPMSIPGVLVAGHGPFTWGEDVREAVDHAIALEAIAHAHLGTLRINPDAQPLPQYVLDRYHHRKITTRKALS